MALQLVHRILIISAIALGVLCAGFVSYRWLAEGDTSLLPTGIVGAVAAIALGLYLRWFMAKRPPSA